MSLINLQTGATAAEEMTLSDAKKIISDLQTRIYKQDLLIRKLNDEANQIQKRCGSPKEIELLKSKLNESENGRKELSETVTRVNKEKQDLQLEINRLYNRPPEIKYKDKCYNCSRDEYDKKLSEIEETEKSAKENHDYFYRLVNNYTAEIDKRVEKIVERKTRFQRFADWLEKFISVINSMVFFVPFLYAVGVTIFAVCRNDVVRNDFVTAGKAVGKVFAAMFFGVKWLILKAAGLSGYVENPAVQKILWWVILILLILIIMAVILFLLFLAAFSICAFYDKFWYEISETFDKAYLAAALADLGLVTFCGDLIKVKIPLNLVATYFIFLAAFTVLKFFVPIIYHDLRHLNASVMVCNRIFLFLGLKFKI